MSGIKYSEVILAKKVEALLKLKKDKNNTQKFAKDTRRKIVKLIEEIDNTSSEDVNISKRMKEDKKSINKQINNVDAEAKKVKNVDMPSNADSTSLDSIEKSINKISNSKNKIQKINQEADSVKSNLVNLTTSDKKLSEIRLEMDKIKEELDSEKELINKWLPEETAELKDEFSSIGQELQEYEHKIKKGEKASKLANESAEIKNRIQKLDQEFDKTVFEASGREEKQQKRLYILDSLREVCESLGFDEASDPYYQEDDDPNSPVVQEFDTVNEGFVTFNINLDSSIESDSEIRINSCQDEFDKLSEILEEQFGVKTSFQRVEDDGEPIRKSYDKKPIPGQTVKQYQQGSN